jgi:hypothetical protein
LPDTGVGLGLAIARTIVQAHAGCIAVTSTAETGTVFRAVFAAIVSSPVLVQESPVSSELWIRKSVRRNTSLSSSYFSWLAISIPIAFQQVLPRDPPMYAFQTGSPAAKFLRMESPDEGMNEKVFENIMKALRDRAWKLDHRKTELFGYADAFGPSSIEGKHQARAENPGVLQPWIMRNMSSKQIQ